MNSIKNCQFYSTISGRIHIDFLIYMLANYKNDASKFQPESDTTAEPELLDDFKLNSIAKYYLKETKEDVAPDKIPILQDGTDDDRCVLGKYCI